ncbi:hypothetical protein MVLG_00352 [Microbotryum lychnidis-dioicae p1A1 Lamole]|uniref:mannosyl-oligosaccharide glucosidase n=1 Tax=Microbotryum lychnidis-dioicae (strain p1A1 Lamole / MvSl-1064) TaxID=683840 RepID=U5GYU1_USTV1|nr:hypothetical protein MVLG_00352 [Microbotryum lychnidis-dioicae p1A1 Lamole]|eukprot:KDE09450.1 hypothetical protein MVLG_00352 [Microbotryum lychnidis-dioicae p1A1 Lamole]
MAVRTALQLVQRSASTSSSDDMKRTRSFLTSIYPKLKSHYEWFRRTQRGQISGMATFAESMKELAGACGEGEDRARFEKEFEDVKGNIDDFHWSEEHQLYLDTTVDSRNISEFVVVRGYVCLFPLLLSLIPVDSPKLVATLEFMRDPQYLWCDYGLRSLTPGEKYYGKDEDYWRGPIWIPICYMALKALFTTYATTPGPYQGRAQKVYIELRQNLSKNMYREYKRTGFVFEQYNDKTGKGQRSYPFTGWSSLIVLIMAEQY